MKTFIPIIWCLLLLTSCSQTTMQYDFAPTEGNSNEKSLLNIISVLDTIKTYPSPGDSAMIEKGVTPKPSNLSLGDTVDLKKELTDLFDPNNFQCGCEGKFKNALKRIKPGTKDSIGFVPKLVMDRVYKYKNAVKIEQSGSYVLTHLFQFSKNDGTISKPVRAIPDNVSAFNQFNYLERSDQSFSNFLYTLDCSGYVSMAIGVAGGVSKASIKASAKSASQTDRSLFLLSGVLYSPLYQAYLGSGRFSKVDSATVYERLQTLKAIINKIPPIHLKPTTEVYLNANYRVLITSNSGKSSFNGEANIEGGGGGSFGVVSISGEAKAGGSIGRASNFSDYNSYILKENVNEEVDKITVADIKKLINDLERQLRTL
jgi:hypothetical protein